MAIYKLQVDTLEAVKTTTFAEESVLERSHLQAALKKDIGIVVPDGMVIAEEFSEWSEGQRRIDLLALDKNANLIVLELKRTETGAHMELQALRYAAMVSTLTFKRATEIYGSYLAQNGIDANPEEKILEFLEWDEPQEEEFAADVQIVLVSADFSKELTTSVIWLNERNVNITCFRFTPYKYGNDLLVDIQQIIPLPEAEQYQISVKRKAEERRQARDSSRDYTKYRYRNNEYNKRKLVLAVIRDWFLENKPESLSELEQAFPNDLRRGGLYVPYEEAAEQYEKYQIPRHFLSDGEVLDFPNGGRYAISNQWGKGTIESFIDGARRQGISIEEV